MLAHLLLNFGKFWMWEKFNPLLQDTIFCIKCLRFFLLEFNSLRAKRAVLYSEVCSAPSYSQQLDRAWHTHLLLGNNCA